MMRIEASALVGIVLAVLACEDVETKDDTATTGTPTTTGSGGAGAASTGSAGAGPNGGTGGAGGACTSCAAALVVGPAGLCMGTAQQQFDALTACACTNCMGVCGAGCDDPANWCQQGFSGDPCAPSCNATACGECVIGSMGACQAEFQACAC
jgi:hypothetical protein